MGLYTQEELESTIPELYKNRNLLLLSSLDLLFWFRNYICVYLYFTKLQIAGCR